MPEDAGELGKGTLGVIPYLFFDIISRVVPGLFLLLGIDTISEHKTIPGILHAAFPDAALRESPSVWLAVLFFSGYILGHLISPVVKLLDRSNEKVSEQYNDLRVDHPAATSIAMRIRGEYIMYGGFAVSLAILDGLGALLQARNILINATGIRGWWDSASQSQHLEGAGLFVLSVVVAWLMLYRNRDTIKTYKDTVRQLHKALHPEATGAKSPDSEDKDKLKRIHHWIDQILP